MNLELISVEKYLKSYLGQVVEDDKIKRFHTSLKSYINKINLSLTSKQNETYHRDLLKEFLIDSIYKDTHEITTKTYKGNIGSDLVIYNENNVSSKSGVIIEVKTPQKKDEMISKTNLSGKSFYETILYYLFEKEEHNNEVKKIIICNNVEWFIFDSVDFRKIFYENSNLLTFFNNWKNKITDNKSTKQMYQILGGIVQEMNDTIKCIYINFLNINLDGYNEELLSIYKILTPEVLLKQSNERGVYTLDKGFYYELLYIMGLEEYEENNKKYIRRSSERIEGSLMENCISVLKSDNSIPNLPKDETKRDKEYFEVSLELTLTWVNRILFLKLLENQLISYHSDTNLSFLNYSKIESFDKLNSLFFKVLSVREQERETRFSGFSHIPYLNSSLFEPTESERLYLRISNLEEIEIPIYKKSKLPKSKVKTLDYLFQFLNLFNFKSSGKGEIEIVNKTLINSSVLGLIFEKINGYKDGSIYTPNYITSFMCRNTLRNYVIRLCNEKFKWNCQSIIDLYNKITDKDITKEINSIIDNLKICDISVGSGHFLVSTLNEILSLKSELGILMDNNGKKLRDYTITVDNDELLIYDENGKLFEYKVVNGSVNPEIQRIQETIFNEKKNIIENSLFGVDINSNSVKICRLRLWIELLKHSYYKRETDFTELETLPNIDINIKCGNSLVNKFQVSENLSSIFNKSNLSVQEYKEKVKGYKETKVRFVKEEIQVFIDKLKLKVSNELNLKKKKDLKKKNEIYLHYVQTLENRKLLELKITKEEKEHLKELKEQYEIYLNQIEEIKNSVIYKNSLEWRIDFPEILDDNGNFEGFDIVIGNPPYLYRKNDIKPYIEYFNQHYDSTQGNYDLYKLFIERCLGLVRKGGFVNQITSSSYLIQESFSKLRQILLEFEILDLSPLGPNSFEDVVVDTSIITICKNKILDNKIEIRSPMTPKELDLTIPYYIKQSRFKDNWKLIFDYKMTDQEWVLYKKLEDSFSSLSIKFETGVGINTGYIKDKLVSERKINEKYHPMVKGNGIERYGEIRTTGFIMYDKEFVKNQGSEGRTLPNEKLMNQDKILIVRTRNLSLPRRIISTIDTKKVYNLNRLSNIIPKDSKVDNLYGLLGILNSELFNWIFSKKYFDYEIKPVYLEICPICETNDKVLIGLVKKRIDKNPPENIEEEIDKHIYKLFKLDESERKLVKC